MCDLEPDNCACNPHQPQCCAENEKWTGSACVEQKDPCEENPNQESCCVAPQIWNGSACVIAQDPCEENPNQEACCVSPQVWNGFECTDGKLDPCKENPNQEICCVAPQKWNGFECADPQDPCEENPNQEACCVEPKIWNGFECTEIQDPCKENPNQEACCVAPKVWNGFACVTAGCDEKKKPLQTVIACGNCNKGTQRVTYTCNTKTAQWEQQSLSSCEILDVWCTPGTKRDWGGETCTTSSKNIQTKSLSRDSSVTVANPVSDINDGTGSTTYTYNAGSFCTATCTWQAKQCPRKGGGGGGGGGARDRGCCGDGTNSTSVRVVDFTNAACVGYVNIDCCTGEQSWAGGGGGC